MDWQEYFRTERTGFINMFGFFLKKKQDNVRRVFSGRMNRRSLQQFRFGDRRDARGTLCEVVFVIPYDDDEEAPQFDRAFPAVSKDICFEGLSFIHNRPVEQNRILIGLEGDELPLFIACTLQHSTPLGFGFFQIGLHPHEVVQVSADSLQALDAALKENSEQVKNCEPSLVQ